MLQNQFTLTPLSVHNVGAAQAPAGTPTPDPRVGKDLQWWEKFRIALQAFPPPPADAPALTKGATAMNRILKAKAAQSA